MSPKKQRVAIIGAGLSGSACARALADAGLEVSVFDKGRNVGGRMATRRATWTRADGSTCTSSFDHGVPAFEAKSPEFIGFLEQSGRSGCVRAWSPAVAAEPGAVEAPGDRPAPEVNALWVGTPDMPSLCRALLQGIDLKTSAQVERLVRADEGWQLQFAGSVDPSVFDVAVVAIPPAQATVLLQPHAPDWIAHLESHRMLPTWTMMAATDEPAAPPPWSVAHPPAGPLGMIVRNDRKPDRAHAPGLAHWVVHASEAWSQAHIEADPEWVESALRDAFERWLGQPLAWRHCVLHRWRYALAPTPATPHATPQRYLRQALWEPAGRIGACGDALGGGGVEGAWTSGRSLAEAILSA